MNLTLGKDKTETVNIDGNEITLRPLTAGELAQLQSLEKQGQAFYEAPYLQKAFPVFPEPAALLRV